MKNNKGSFLMALWWLMGCLCLGVLLVLLAPREARVSEDENRMLAGFPELTRESFTSGDFFSGIEDYLSDGFFARADVIDFTDGVLEVFNRQTEEQRQMQDEARTNELLTADAGMKPAQEPDEKTVSAPATTPTATAAPTPTATPTATPTVTPTVTPTAAPTATPTVTPTATPSATPTPEPTAVLTEEPTPAPTPTATPTPTPTPKVIVPLPEDAEYSLELIAADGRNSHIYSYPAANLMTFANSLNHLKSLLPEDGEVHYMQVPVAAVGRRISVRFTNFTGWKSTMEEALQTQVKDGVIIYDIPAILNDALAAKEDLYYYTDHHWTPLGAWYAVEAVAQQLGYPMIPYEEYEYTTRELGTDDAGRKDWLNLLHPLSPTHSYVLKRLTEETEIDFQYYKATGYHSYINNTRTPWRRFTSGFGSDRRALVICDSFGNVFLPYLLPYYGEVHMTDLRDSYFNREEAGGTFTELVRYHGIDDIYVVLSTSNGINSHNSLKVFWDYITE